MLFLLDKIIIYIYIHVIYRYKKYITKGGVSEIFFFLKYFIIHQGCIFKFLF